MLPVPPILMHWLAPFAAVFTKPTWDRVLVLATERVNDNETAGVVN